MLNTKLIERPTHASYVIHIPHKFRADHVIDFWLLKSIVGIITPVGFSCVAVSSVTIASRA